MSAECSPGNIPPGYKQTEVGVIPKDWEVKLLGNTAILKTRIGWQGLTTSEYLECGDYYLVTGTEFKDGYIDWDNCHYVTESRYKQDKNIQLKENDILVTKDGTIGKVALINNLHKLATLNSGVFVIRPLNGAFHPVFFYYLLCSNLFKEFLAQLSAGSTINHLYQKDFVNFLYKTPPTKAEQEAIAEVLGDADAFIESLEQLISKKRQIKQGAMQELLTGKRRLPGFSGEWSNKRLMDLAVLSKAGVNPASFPDTQFAHFSLPAFDAGEVPVIEEGSLIGSNKFLMPMDAVLLSKLNPRIPRIWAPSHIPENSVCSTEFLVLVPPESTDRKFLAALCCSSSVCYQMELHATGTTGSHQRIHPSQALTIEVRVPHDKAEQTAIAAILSDMDSEITALEEKLAKARQLKQGMMQELLTGRTRLL